MRKFIFSFLFLLLLATVSGCNSMEERKAEKVIDSYYTSLINQDYNEAFAQVHLYEGHAMDGTTFSRAEANAIFLDKLGETIEQGYKLTAYEILNAEYEDGHSFWHNIAIEGELDGQLFALKETAILENGRLIFTSEDPFVDYRNGRLDGELVENLKKTDCPDAKISWVDVLKINDITYESDSLFEGETFETGQKIGEVQFRLAESACSNHRLQNGDAAFLAVGTEIFELIGYKSDFRVVAGNKVYQVKENKKAKTLTDLLDIEGKVAKMSYESDFDGSHITDFTKQETATFIADLLSLDYVGHNQAAKQMNGDNRVFLRIHLQDGSSFSVVYWPDGNVLSLGAFGTETMKRIVLEKSQ